jgi:hypothetical protein
MQLAAQPNMSMGLNVHRGRGKGKGKEQSRRQQTISHSCELIKWTADNDKTIFCGQFLVLAEV